MTKVDFHTHVDDGLLYACRLARKVHAAGQAAIVVADGARLDALDTLLWTFSPLDFIPHCRHDQAHAAHTPIVLAERAEPEAHQRILINLTDRVPENFARFERLLEVIDAREEALAAGRERYKFYRDRGYLLKLYRRDEREGAQPA